MRVQCPQQVHELRWPGTSLNEENNVGCKELKLLVYAVLYGLMKPNPKGLQTFQDLPPPKDLKS